MNKKKLIDKLVRTPTNARQVLHFVDGRCNVIIGDEIANYKTIDQVLDPHGRAFIMYMSSDNYGHWCAIVRRGRTISLFDPYGKFTEHYNKEFKTTHRGHLARLLINSKYSIEYSDYEFQKDYSSTCGLWCSLFLIFCEEMTVDEFIAKFKGLSEEKLVTLFWNVDGNKK